MASDWCQPCMRQVDDIVVHNQLMHEGAGASAPPPQQIPFQFVNLPGLGPLVKVHIMCFEKIVFDELVDKISDAVLTKLDERHRNLKKGVKEVLET